LPNLLDNYSSKENSTCLAGKGTSTGRVLAHDKFANAAAVILWINKDCVLHK